MVHESPFQVGRNKAGHPSDSARSATPVAAHHAPVIQTHCSHEPQLVEKCRKSITLLFKELKGTDIAT